MEHTPGIESIVSVCVGYAYKADLLLLAYWLLLLIHIQRSSAAACSAKMRRRHNKSTYNSRVLIVDKHP